MTVPDWIQRIEARLRNVLIALAVLTLVVFYDWRCFHDFNCQEAMDSAQLALNITEGRGYTTYFIRPLSIQLLQRKNMENNFGRVSGTDTDPAQLKGMHPDLANPPVYPCLLAVWIKTYQTAFKVMNAITSIMPESIRSRLPEWNEDPASRCWSRGGHFWWWPGDFCIAMLNQALFLVVAVLTFRLARRLFDNRVAWMSVALMAGTEILWRFSVSGLSTMLLLVIVMGLMWCLVYMEQEISQPKWRPRVRLVWLPMAAGLLLAAGAMTRYSFGWLVIPVVLFLVWFGGPRKTSMCLVLAGTFLLACTPWICRNFVVSGTPFGTAGYAIMDGTYVFPEHQLERSMKPIPEFDGVRVIGIKLLTNARKILQGEVMQLGGSWVTPLFMVGLLVAFRNPTLGRLRAFVLASLITLVIVQAGIRTQLSDDSSDINSENLLILLMPLVLVYGVSLFFVLVDQMKYLSRNLRILVTAVFGTVTWLPMLGALGPPQNQAPAWPPYLPPAVKLVSGWMNENELMMSDAPWAVAWYGRRQCVWLTMNCREDFFAINDYIKPVRAIYLTPQIMDAHIVTQWIKAGQSTWGSFMLRSIVENRPSPAFPLQHVLNALLPEQLFITDGERWRTNATVSSLNPGSPVANDASTNGPPAKMEPLAAPTLKL